LHQASASTTRSDYLIKIRELVHGEEVRPIRSGAAAARKVSACAASMVLLLLSLLCTVHAQQPASTSEVALQTDAVGPMRFVAVHGRRSVIMGYPAKGLEVWGYPFQILTDYQIGFKPKGTSAEADGRLLLRSIAYQPDAITRTYVGADYLVRETIFVPLDDAAAIIRYEVEGTRQLDIIIHFQPVLDLMWPAAVGGQYTRWLESAPGYQIAEPEHGMSALIGSAESVAHDDTLNSTVHADTRLAFTIRPVPIGRGAAAAYGTSAATVYVVLNTAHAVDPAAALHELSQRVGEKEAEAKAHYTELESRSLCLHTPDAKVNSAVAWAQIALDQAWVCNRMIGCGIVAGYGPSRDARRPQYAWYFAGDGLIATNALVSAGAYTRAKEELEFIAKYQEPATGMIWHELSQSSGYIDWSKYPYMYVHVDISFDYISTVARYVTSSGDTSFATDHWLSILKAYSYCRSLIRDADHLPHIPADKEAGDEQARPGDDLSLSAGWLAASSGFEELARLTGHARLADGAHTENQLTRRSIPAHYWDSKKNFWIDGHSQTGTPIPSRRRGPSQLIEQHVFSETQQEALLDQIASSDFQTDWGLREVAASSADFDPYSYGRGSVTAPSTTQTAITFWKEHRPTIANAIWSEMLPWNTLDSPGHIHEVLAGSFYHEQAESVPEQTWSSAGLLDATVRGLLGLTVHGDSNFIQLSPHLPPQWDRISIDNVRLAHSKLDFALSQGMRDIDLEISNQGGATKLLFEPQIPLGAHLLSAEFQGHPVSVDTEIFSEDQTAKLTLDLPPGGSHFHLRFEGGISVILVQRDFHVGDRSTGLKLTNLHLQEHTFSIDADVYPQRSATFELRTPWRIVAHPGASILALPDSKYEVTLEPGTSPVNKGAYRHVHATLTFAS